MLQQIPLPPTFKLEVICDICSQVIGKPTENSRTFYETIDPADGFTADNTRYHIHSVCLFEFWKNAAHPEAPTTSKEVLPI